MTSYVALLRAVNVGGRQLRMSEAKSIASKLGYGSPKTFIASGNLLFTSRKSEALIKRELETAFTQHLGKAVEVMVRTAGEIAQAVEDNPFAAEPGNRVVAIFFDDPPSKDSTRAAKNVTNERLAQGRREIYVHFPDGQGRSKLKLGGRALGTARNMNTVVKLAALSKGDVMSKERPIAHEFEGESLESTLVGRRDGQSRPTVILIPTVMGVSDLEKGFGRQLVELGYNAIVADLFGKKFHGAPRDTMFGEMTRLRSDRAALRRRLEHVLEIAREQPEVRSNEIVVAGYCFGGQCAIDLARSGADIAAAVSFHGLFDPPGLPPKKISAKVVAYHGWDDPMVPPDKVVALGQELTEAGCDWQIHAYGHVGHGFTNPHASELQIDGVAYNALAAERSWTSFVNLLEELFGEHG